MMKTDFEHLPLRCKVTKVKIESLEIYFAGTIYLIVWWVGDDQAEANSF